VTLRCQTVWSTSTHRWPSSFTIQLSSDSSSLMRRWPREQSSTTISLHLKLLELTMGASLWYRCFRNNNSNTCFPHCSSTLTRAAPSPSFT